MEQWQHVLQQSITSPEELSRKLECDTTALGEVIANFPMLINPYFLQLIEKAGDPLGKQAIPDPAELLDNTCIPDPLAEEELSPVPNLVHKYQNRVLFLVSSKCAMYCRFCTRKRKVGTTRMKISEKTLEQGYEYIRNHPEIQDVLISGGDPLLLPDMKLHDILGKIRAIPHVEIIRIGSRTPCVLPMRITDNLVSVLKQFHPLYINTHFNHPAEITEQAGAACAKLADAGIPLGCQTVLLRGVNDDIETLQLLFRKLLKIRVKPYYLFQSDLTRGVEHFRTPTSVGIDLMRQLYGHLSGMAIPAFVLDAPGGKGKIPLTGSVLFPVVL